MLTSSSSLKTHAHMWLLVIYSRNESRPRDPRSGWAAGSWGGVLERTWPGDPDFRVRSIKLRVKSLLGWAVMIRKIIYQIGEWKYISFSAVQFSSVTQWCPTLCDPMNCSTPGLPCPSPTPGVHSDSHPSSQ